MPASRQGRGFDAKATPQHNEKIATEVPLDPEKRNKVPDAITVAGARWYVATTAPQQELRAAESIRRIEGVPPIVPYVPCEFFWRRPERGNLKLPKREFQRPMVRSYLFLRAQGDLCDHSLAKLRERDAEGRNRHGLVGILGSHTRGALPMSDVGLSWLSEMAEAERSGDTILTPAAPFDRGDAVRISSGPMTGFLGRAVLVDLQAGEVVVEISLLGHTSEGRFVFDHVHKAA